eukprot:SAG31_NODE_5133_length_2722_cov_11.441860_1_plen_66_part_10
MDGVFLMSAFGSFSTLMSVSTARPYASMHPTAAKPPAAVAMTVVCHVGCAEEPIGCHAERAARLGR